MSEWSSGKRDTVGKAMTQGQVGSKNGLIGPSQQQESNKEKVQNRKAYSVTGHGTGIGNTE